MLVDLHGMRSASSAALAKFARCLPTTRMALVGTSPVEHTIVQFFRTLHRPTYPATYFTKDAEAWQWLTDGRYKSAPDILPQTQQKGDSDFDAAVETIIPARRFRISAALAKLVHHAAEAQPEAPSSLIQRPAADELTPERPAQVSAETLDLITKAFRGKTQPKAFSMALGVAEILDAEAISAFADLIGRCAAAERSLIASHLYRHYRRSPAKLALWINTAQHSYFHARWRVANSGIRRARLNPGKITTARLVDRDSAGHNVRQETRDAVSLVSGLVYSPWPGQIGIGAQRNIISVGASLARVLVAEGDNHGLAVCYREYTDIYDARYSLVEEGTGIIDFILKYPEKTELLCEYIQGGKYDTPETLLRAVTSSARFLRYLERTRTANKTGRSLGAMNP
ncbi:hypothetical protein [Arthrobacter sulfonylureivorans]|uniref:DUF7793 domain-containing protein n=1 Tax=Arthrobacter sulfonylureivorans TaxID=2486855 RepID=A0ABY3WJM3_9MICC|nr:hypothetical protein [Arthrobacter sulfonylureivorans]UNK47839.1 hypothetical protein MNQ99_18355 [Arthrobacter sulfonylureivorans]